MRVRRLISILAVLGVLAHAGALVRHNGVMLGALLQHQQLIASLTAMCHGAGPAADTELPFVPPPSGTEHGCPICSGLTTAFALAGPDGFRLALPLPAAVHLPIPPAADRSADPPARPFARGPPARA